MWGLIVSLSVLCLVVVIFKTSSKRPPLPPGPKAKFWTGNAHQLPTTEPWLTYAVLSQMHGPVVYFRVHGRRMHVLNTLKVALDLLESRVSLYSDRPMAWMYKELVGRELAVFNISVKHPRFKIYRKLLQSGLNQRATRTYRAIQEEETRTLFLELARSPEQFVSHIRRNAGAVILKVAYGWTVAENDDDFVLLMEESIKVHAEIVKPGRWLVDTYPILRFVPKWFPFANFHRQAEIYRKEFSRIDAVPHAWAKEQIESGHYLDSFVSLNLRPDDGHIPDPEEENMFKWCSSALYAGGADTVVGVVTTFFLLSLHRQVQRRAQAEIDRVVGNMLPSIDDEPHLPYVSALLKEVLRWAPVPPLGLPHRVVEDDSYNGYWIPKGTTVYANIWSSSHSGLCLLRVPNRSEIHANTFSDLAAESAQVLTSLKCPLSWSFRTFLPHSTSRKLLTAPVGRLSLKSPSILPSQGSLDSENGADTLA
ncbi:predicted protein [Postia placenta Mad-698-R]|uniref:Cytochrome P450 n=1 Tax=Postia placenta MAD-698-R-SB12 TaxID=670580 RepID=A0A1X6MYT2_9APHY|nr:hypothetical protein POSPLADRAFT_1046859 [Postia placenta MAD-698-R-SB12]EED83433.1 predicted protein [Postia placenta Mad-698-R]OSX61524.1 hypothetical protein POSPLADRAFT_1046859 [Postia placenta MAD-698-R-SB12]